MTKVVYNACFGGFSLSEAALYRYAALRGITLYPEKEERFGFTTYWTVPDDQRTGILSDDEFPGAPLEKRVASNEAYGRLSLGHREFERDDPVLVQVVEEMGDAANGAHAKLSIRDVPKGTRYRIDEYDGSESVMTVEDYEWKIAS